MSSLPEKDLRAIFGDEWVEAKKRIEAEPRFSWLRRLFARFKPKS